YQKRGIFMKDHFIENVEFKNFKCFQELQVKNLRRVNLISGKNNIGKTSFMEGLELFLSSKDIYEVLGSLYKMIRRRQYNYRQSSKYLEFDVIYQNNSTMEINSQNSKLKIEYFDEFIKKTDTQNRMIEHIDVPSVVNQNLFGEDDLIVTHEPALKITLFGEERVVPLERIISERVGLIKRNTEAKATINYVSSSTTDEKEIAIYYGRLVDINKEKYLDESLSLFDENIVALKQKVTERDVVLKLALKDRATPILLSSLGEGINRYIAILCAIWASKDGYLFIDEIENGIHYTNYKKLWKIIFEASKMANCQIFTTTHSKECIEAFNEVNQEDEGIYLEFYRNQKNGLIVVKERGNEQLEYALTHNSEIRG
ncbi:MAG: AAA family ATPase, partial [Sulfurimonas sp.]|nr:AAA family ATPase [Sulfurimonas sp.]